jgi:hypothetical protein
MPFTRHPPHRSRQALLTSWAPVSGNDAQAFRRVRLANPGIGEPSACRPVHPRPRDLVSIALVHHGHARFGLSVRTLARSPRTRHRVSRFPRNELPCMHGVSDPAGPAHPSPYRCGQCCFPSKRRPSAPGVFPLISGLNTQPARTPVNASLTPLPVPMHDSGPVWLASPDYS